MLYHIVNYYPQGDKTDIEFSVKIITSQYTLCTGHHHSSQTTESAHASHNSQLTGFLSTSVRALFLKFRRRAQGVYLLCKVSPETKESLFAYDNTGRDN